MIFKHDINNFLNTYYSKILLCAELPGLIPTTRYIYGKEVHYLVGLQNENWEDMTVLLKTLKVECTVNSLDDLNSLYGVRFSQRLTAAMENFFCDETGNESYTIEKASDYLLHQLAEWDTLRDEDGQRLFYETTRPDGTIDYHFFFVKYCAITPKKWDHEWVAKHGM